MDLKHLTLEHFAALVGATFRADLGEQGAVELELTRAEKAKGEDRPDHAFSVVFRGPPEPFLPQGMRDMKHDDLGSHPIFLVPIARDEDGFLYEAVFTRLD